MEKWTFQGTTIPNDKVIESNATFGRISSGQYCFKRAIQPTCTNEGISQPNYNDPTKLDHGIKITGLLTPVWVEGKKGGRKMTRQVRIVEYIRATIETKDITTFLSVVPTEEEFWARFGKELPKIAKTKAKAKKDVPPNPLVVDIEEAAPKVKQAR